jgi:hypothetical protein
MAERTERDALKLRLLQDLVELRTNLKAANPYGEPLAEAISLFWDASTGACAWERENAEAGGLTAGEQGLLDLHIREFQRGRPFDPDHPLEEDSDD